MTDAAPRPHPTLVQRLGRLGRLVRKELAEILRDRRTIGTLVLMPLLLYPLVAIGFQQYLAGRRLAQATPEYRLGFRAADEGELFLAFLRGGEPLLLKPFETEHPTQALDDGQIDVLVQPRQPIPRQLFRDGPAVNRALAVDWELHYREDSALGLDAVRYLEGRIAEANERFLAAQLRALGAAQRPRPFQATVQARVDPSARRTSTLAVVVPLVLILMTITGAVYPAIDLTAGERERGTLEVLVAAPIPRLAVLFAKYVAVLTVAMLTAGVNLAAMVTTLWATGMGQALLAGQQVGALVLVEVIGLLLLFAAFFSAVLLALTSFARSFKEAQAYLIPLMLVSMTPGMVGLIPGVELGGVLAVVPLLNVVLLARDLIAGHAAAATAAIVVLSTALYALAALSLAARVFGAEAVLYSQSSSWSDLLHRPRVPRDYPRPSSALVTLAFMFPANFLLVYLPSHWPHLPFAGTLMLGALANVLLFVGFPGAALAMGRVRPATALALHRPGVVACLAAVLLGVSLWPLSHVLNLALREAGFTLLTDELLRKLRDGLQRWREVSPVLIVVELGLLVPILEELFFRGFLFGALRQRLRPWPVIAATAALFGLFHIFSPVGLTPERLLTTGLMGVVLGWARWRSGSVVPGILLHALHNTSIVLLGYYQPQLEAGGWLPGGERMPVAWILGASGGAIVGLGAMIAGTMSSRERTASVVESHR